MFVSLRMTAHILFRMRTYFSKIMSFSVFSHSPDIRPTTTFFGAALLALILICVTRTLQAQNLSAESRPNIIVILADDLGYGDLSSYGASDLKTPNIDALVSDGIRFNQSYANCPVCSPTRAALLTGRYPDLVGVPGVIRSNPQNSWGFLSRGSVLLPQLLRKAGYETALIGKWHLGLERPNTPNDRGFNFFHGFLGDMMDDYYNHLRHGTNYMRLNRQVIDPKGHATDLFSDWSVQYLNERKNDKKPFFLYLAYNAPHTPIQPPTEWFQKVRERDPNLSERRARLIGLIEHMDAGIGRVVDTLRTNGQYQNTFIAFTSDNGGQLNVGANCGPLRGGKQDLYEGGIRVPMCAVWPGQIRAGTASDQITLTMDLFPTVCEVAQVKINHNVEGVTLLPNLLDSSRSLPERDLFWMRREGGGRYLGQDYYALRRGNWKLVHNRPFEPYQLYNLGVDPLEENDLASRETRVFRDLTRELQAQLQKSGNVPWQPEDNSSQE